MTARQKILKAVYPLIIGAGKLFGAKKTMQQNPKKIQPPVSFFDLSYTRNNGEVVPMSTYRGKNILIVNTASDCGFTGQYAELQEIYKQLNSKLVIIGFPANDFKEQEKGTDEEIARFCSVNYGVTFPLSKKASVIKSPAQHPVFAWLSDSKKNGWNNKAPSWNFSKYLLDGEGRLISYMDPVISPAVVSEQLSDEHE